MEGASTVPETIPHASSSSGRVPGKVQLHLLLGTAVAINAVPALAVLLADVADGAAASWADAAVAAVVMAAAVGPK